MSSDSNPAAVMLAEHQRVSELYLHNAAMGERRVTIHLFFLAGGGTLFLKFPDLMGLHPNSDSILPIIDRLILPGAVILLLVAVEGILTFRRLIERRIRAVEYLRAINRINRFFANQSSEVYKCLPWPPCDDKPDFCGKPLGVADLRNLVAVLNCFYAGILGAGASQLALEKLHAALSPADHPTSGNWLSLIAIVLGVLAARVAWWWHSRYEDSIIQQAENKFRSSVAFPSPNQHVEASSVNRVGGGFSPPPPTPPSMRVRTGRFTEDEQARPEGLK